MQKKKSRFWLFIWSLVPGAGEMYLGFMKMGISLMLGFMILIAVAALTNLGALAIFPIAVYIYSFFLANNLGALNDAEFYGMEDKYLFGLEGLNSIEKVQSGLSQKYRKIAAIVLIVIGVIMLWQTVFNLLCDIFGWDNYYLSAIYYFTRDELPRIAIGIAIIWVGIGLIRGKKAEYFEEDWDTERKQNAFGDQNIMNEQNVYEGQETVNVQDEYDKQRRMNVQDISEGQRIVNVQNASGEQRTVSGQDVSGGQNITNAQNVSAGQDMSSAQEH